jgi:ferritin-like metal-binding protein YciE
MGFFTKDIKTLDDLFVHTLRDIYYAEQQIAKNLPDMVEKATDQSLKNGFETHLGETKEKYSRCMAWKPRALIARPSTAS